MSRPEEMVVFNEERQEAKAYEGIRALDYVDTRERGASNVLARSKELQLPVGEKYLAIDRRQRAAADWYDFSEHRGVIWGSWGFIAFGILMISVKPAVLGVALLFLASRFIVRFVGDHNWKMAGKINNSMSKDDRLEEVSL